MTISVTSPLTGAAQTGFTTPTYTLVADNPPANNAKQWFVSALGGTQAGVSVHSIAAPFTISCFRPLVPKVLNPVLVNGSLSKVPVNTYKVITRKGVTPLAGQAQRTMTITSVIDVPAGADTADAANIRAALSAHIGALSQQAAGVGDTAIQGTL